MKIIFSLLLLLITGLPVFSQCDKKVSWYATRGEMYDAAGTLLDTRQDSIFFQTDQQKVTLRFKSDNQELEGSIKEKTCDWKETFKNGKTVYHTIVHIEGTNSDATFTLEAKDGKIKLSLVIEIRQERRFVIYIDKYEEIK